MAKKYVYSFGGGKADGKAKMKQLLLLNTLKHLLFFFLFRE